MFWILRRTGAANFFSSLHNNNNSNSSCNSNNNISHKSNYNNNNNALRQAKYVKRPPRKAYGRLAADIDAESEEIEVPQQRQQQGEEEVEEEYTLYGNDVVPVQHKIDGPFDDSNNFDENGNAAVPHPAVSANNFSNYKHATPCTALQADVSALDGQRNFAASDLCDLNDCSGNESAERFSLQNQHMKRLHELALAKALGGAGAGAGDAVEEEEDDYYDESLTCNVCDRGFTSQRQLSSHQQKKRHFGCDGCDSLFPSIMLLEHHKEEFEHWSDDDDDDDGAKQRICCRRNRDDYFTDTDSFSSEAESEDQERLL